MAVQLIFRYQPTKTDKRLAKLPIDERKQAYVFVQGSYGIQCIATIKCIESGINLIFMDQLFYLLRL